MVSLRNHIENNIEILLSDFLKGFLNDILEPQVGFEPTTCSLQVSCTTTVLLRHNVGEERFELSAFHSARVTVACPSTI